MRRVLWGLQAPSRSGEQGHQARIGPMGAGWPALIGANVERRFGQPTRSKWDVIAMAAEDGCGRRWLWGGVESVSGDPIEVVDGGLDRTQATQISFRVSLSERNSQRRQCGGRGGRGMCLKTVEQEAGGSVRQTTRSMTGGAARSAGRDRRASGSAQPRSQKPAGSI